MNEIKLKLYKIIWKHVSRARFKALIKQFTESMTGHYSKNGSNISNRISLKKMAKNNSVYNASKQSTSLQWKMQKLILIESITVSKNK